MDIKSENTNKNDITKDINKEKQDKKDQLEKDLILAEKEYDALFKNINKRRADYLEQELKKKNKK
jgi:chromosome condensin MukBEF ATPase and DNA-binding subunit MukB